MTKAGDRVKQEVGKYHYANIYKSIAETGRRPDGTRANQLEKAIAPHVDWIEPVKYITEAIAWKQVATFNTQVSSQVKQTPNPYKGLTDQQVADKFVEGLDIYGGKHKNYGSKIFEKSGSLQDAISDLDEMIVGEIETFSASKNTTGFRGKLSDGTTVVAREISTDGRPTLEFQLSDRKYEVRYGEK